MGELGNKVRQTWGIVERMSKDDLRGLVRATPRDPTSRGFWVAWAALIPDMSAESQQSCIADTQNRWAAILNGMARVGHSEKMGLGRLLGQAKYSELRMQGLLRARGDLLIEGIYRAVDFIHGKHPQARVNWVQIAWLLLADRGNGDSRADAVRAIEQDYYESHTKD